MSSVTNQSNSIVDPFGWRRRDSLYLAISLLIGAAGAVSRDLSESGLLLGVEAPVALFVPIWMILLFGIEIFRRRVFRGILWPPFALLIVVLSWAISSATLPDAARVYFKFRQSYIEANWKTDPQTGVIYFPIRYISVDDKGVTSAKGTSEVPFFFLIFDEYQSLIFAPFSNQLSSPSCPQAKYQARKIESRVYLVRSFIDDPDEISRPCLVTPRPVKHD